MKNQDNVDKLPAETSDERMTSPIQDATRRMLVNITSAKLDNLMAYVSLNACYITRRTK